MVRRPPRSTPSPSTTIFRSHAKAKMELASLAGFDAIRMTSIWKPGETEVAGDELAVLETAAAAASLHGIRIVLSVYHRSEEHTSELQSRQYLVCRLLLEKKK